LTCGHGGYDPAVATVRIDEYTDPGCPWAWSAEPFRQRIRWLYGDAIEWRLHMVGLSESPEEYLEKGFTPEKMAASFADISRDHGMPIATHERPRMAATLPACRAVVAVREHCGQDAARRLLRALRLRHFGGELLDEESTLRGAARDAQLDGEQLLRWCAEPEVEAALHSDMAAARRPSPAALALDEKLAGWSGGRRYTCPSYEIERLADGVRVSAPGFQPAASYEVVLANLIPDVERRPAPETVEEVLDWAGEPLATEEVAVVMGIDRAQAREQLGAVAVEEHLGADGLWSLPRYSRGSSAASSPAAEGTTASAPASASAE
jgi:predicted DsbA family dithiol-disulfide isomerase